jgi:hypothetical protein
MCEKKSSSTTATGGDRGMVAGIGLSTMIEVGVSMEEFQYGIMGYPVVGEMIIETISGEDIRGTIVIYITETSKETGELGTIPAIGINQSIVSLHITTMGECMVDAIKEIVVKEIVVKEIAIKEIVVQVLNSTTKVRRQVSIIKVQEQ